MLRLLCAALLTMAATARAADLPSPWVADARSADALSRFVALGRADESAAGDRFAVVGLALNQEAGQLALAVQQVQVTRGGRSTVASGIKLTTPLATDDAYLNNPVGGLLAALVRKGEVRVDRVDSSGRGAGEVAAGIRDVLLRVSEGAFEGTLAYGILRARATGSLAWDGSLRRLVVTISSVSAGVPISLDTVFQQLAAALKLDWILVVKPTVTVVIDEAFR